MASSVFVVGKQQAVFKCHFLVAFQKHAYVRFTIASSIVFLFFLKKGGGREYKSLIFKVVGVDKNKACLLLFKRINYIFLSESLFKIVKLTTSVSFSDRSDSFNCLIIVIKLKPHLNCHGCYSCVIVSCLSQYPSVLGMLNRRIYKHM